MDWTRREALAGLPAIALAGCGAQTERPPASWVRLSAAAPFPGAYGFPVHVAADGRAVALHPHGTWSTRDGAGWTREPLPALATSHAYLALVQHAGATWSLANVTGDYRDFRVEPLTRRTADYRAWEVVGRPATLPRLIFPAVASFRGALWLLGGFDGDRTTNAIWRSQDGLAWQRVAAAAPWSPRSGAKPIVFRNQLWLIGGGAIDGAIASEVWSSEDGLTWRQEAPRLAEPHPFGYTPQVFADRMWLLGANRSGAFTSELLVSDNGRRWTPQRAPWSPRGAPAAWVLGDRLLLTGGKFSRPGPAGEPVFVYSNDVWAMIA